MEILTFAPVIIPTLNRYDHLKRCVESLSRCIHADKTELIIGIDYPPSDKYVEGWKMINEYVPTITGFKKVTVFRHEMNMGQAGNNKVLHKYSKQHYDRYISSEDDNEFSPNFLDYMNKALEAYKDHPKVLGISGYNYLEIDMTGYNHPYYFSHEMSGWGYGTWYSEKVNKVERAIVNPRFLFSLIKDVPFMTFIKDKTKRCNLVFEVGLDYRGDGRRTYYEWNYDMYCLFPTISMSRNWGFDGSGLHCGDKKNHVDPYSVQQIDDRKTFEADFKLPVEYDEDIRRRLLSFQTGYFRLRIKKIILLALLKLFVKIRKY